MSGPVLVLGASGYTGSAVTRELVKRGGEVRGLIRNAGNTDAVKANGVSEVIVGDFLELETVELAMKGADGVWFIGPRFMAEEETLGVSMVDAAARAGVRKFVLSGVYHPVIKDLVNHQVKRTIEDHIYKSDLDFTVLQPSRYMHGLMLSTWDSMIKDGVIADAFNPDQRFAYVDYNDVAEVAAIAFTDDRLARGTFELSSQGEYTGHELAESLGAVLGKKLRAEQVPLLEYKPAGPLLKNPYSADGFKRLRAYYDQYGFHGGNALVLEAILGRKATSFPEFVERFSREG